MYLIVILSVVVGIVLFGLFLKVFTKNNTLKHYDASAITTKQTITTYLLLALSVMWIIQAIMLFMNMQTQLLQG